MRYSHLLFFLLLSFSAFSDDIPLEFKPSSQQSTLFDLSNIHDVRSNAVTVIRDRLKFPNWKDSMVDRIGSSDWFSAAVGPQSYVIDNKARYWLKSNLSEMYLIENGIERVSISNDYKILLMQMMNVVKPYVYDLFPVYPSLHPTKNVVVYAFIDVSCPYCRKFHLDDMSKWREKGITWVYLPFLRDVHNKVMARVNNNVFCQDNIAKIKENLDSAFYLTPKKLKGFTRYESCNKLEQNMLDFMLTNGDRFSLAGSPMFVSESGQVLYGVSSLQVIENSLLNN